MYRRAIEYLPYYPHAINNLGLALEQQGRLDEARQCFATAKAMDPALRGVEINVARLAR
jgi:Flp pilus assembly protein TadD